MRFSRADWITVGVTLMLFGLTYYFSGRKVASFCLFAGIAILVIMMFLRGGKRDSGPSSASHESHQTANPVVVQNANPTININVVPQGQPEPPSTLPAPRPKPNINFVEAKSVLAHGGQGEIYESPPGLGDFQVSVVCFRNDPLVGQGIQQPSVTAHIVYKDNGGAEVTDVPRGVWLGQYGESAVFETGKKRCLIVFLLNKQDTLMKLWNESYYSRDSWMSGGPSFRLRDAGISAKIACVEMSLIAHDACLLRATFDVTPYDCGHLPDLVLRSISRD